MAETMTDDNKPPVLDKSYSFTRAEQKQWEAPLPDKDKPVDPNTPKCIVCGRALMASHQENKCLRQEVTRLRGEIETLAKTKDEEIATLRNLVRLERAGRELPARPERP